MQGSLHLKKKFKHSGTDGFLLYLRASGADGGNTPALFLASGKRASGVHERPYEGWLCKPPLFAMIYKEENYYYYVSV